MFKNYVKVAYRQLWKAKTISAINIAGLGTGMACCLLILLFITDEFSYNSFNKKEKDIYNLTWITKQTDGQIVKEATSPLPFAPTITPRVAGIEAAARLYQRSGEMQVENAINNKRFQEQNIYFSDNSLFDIFSFHFISGGENKTALSAPNSVVITDAMSAKYFGTTDPVGKTLLYENRLPLQITGVIKRMPKNSDLQFDFLISLETLYSIETPAIAQFLKEDWTYTPCYTFLLLRHGQQPALIEKQLNQLLRVYGNDRNRQMNTVSIDPLEKIHLYASDVQNNLSTNSISYIYIFTGIALLILLIANINFINLSVAQSVVRTREIGMRKILGAAKRQLVIQFLGESLLVTFIGFLIAFILAVPGLSLLNQLTGKQLSWQILFKTSNILLFAGMMVISGLLAGLYPAFFITRFKTALSVKGKSVDTAQRNTVRKTLLVAQFTICTSLVIGSIIIYEQLQFMRNKPLGFQKDQMITIPIFGSNASVISNGVDVSIRQHMNSFSNELMNNSRVRFVTATSALPGQNIVNGLVIPQGFTNNSNIFVPWISVDYNFLQAFNIPLVAGRSFSKATGTDHLNAFIINESAMHSFNWANAREAIGKNIIRGEATSGKKGQIIGVIKDFHLTTLDQPFQPLILDVNAPRFSEFAINVQPDHLPSTISFIEKTWSKFFPERVFEYSFLDKELDKLYTDKERLSRLIGDFAIIAIVLSCMGLFSLATFLSIQRAREIGIRKVLGASVSQILVLLSKEFLSLITLAFIIAIPVSWWVMDKWLQGFAFRIHISWLVFGAAAIFVLIMAGLTMSFQSIKAATVNPVKSLRIE